MSVDFQEIGFGFGPVTGRSQELRYEYDFGRRVIKASTAIKTFIARFDNSDKELHLFQIITSIERIVNTKVTVKVTFLLRDNSGNIDDKYSGAVHVLVIADLESRVQPPIFQKAAAIKKSSGSKKITTKKK